ncbi:hypothetical protein LINPERPRIM_LOCUS35739 [Linum perenne]
MEMMGSLFWCSSHMKRSLVFATCVAFLVTLCQNALIQTWCLMKMFMHRGCASNPIRKRRKDKVRSFNVHLLFIFKLRGDVVVCLLRWLLDCRLLSIDNGLVEDDW